jgi:aspartyl-tRNA(Asn)/glutamyl-tRNA(Gln) amidotransferase subunit C
VKAFGRIVKNLKSPENENRGFSVFCNIILSMSLSIEEVEHIAALARLDLTGEEKTRYAGQLSAILEYAARLQALDTAGIPPTSSARSVPAHNPLRPDEPRPGLTLDQLLQNAPETQDRQFRVPPVLD